jgi:hypothetical protein
MPHLVQVAEEWRERGGSVLGISQDLFVPEMTREQALAKVRAFVQARRIPFPMFVIDDENPDAVSDRYSLPGPIPVTLAFDATGKEVDRQEGSADLERLREMMRRAVGELPR